MPDPTALTTAQLIREIEGLREIIKGDIEGLRTLHAEKFKSIEVQFAERDTRTEQMMRDSRAAIDVALQAAKEAAAAIDEKTAHLQALHDEKFRSIAVQFSERDVRTEQTSRDAKKAVEDALTAAKEAVAEQNRSSALSIAKSEASTIKSIDQQGLLITTSTKALDDKILDVKDRITRLESKEVGATFEATKRNISDTNQQMSNSTIVAIVMAAVSVLGILILIAEKIAR